MTTMGQTVVESRCQSNFKGETPFLKRGYLVRHRQIEILPLAEGLGKGAEDSVLPALHHSCVLAYLLGIC
jgi:hypothetical protein